MISLFTENEFKNAKINDSLPCKCKQCNNEFKLSKHNILRVLNPNTKRTGDFCSDACRRNARKTKKSVVCLNCNRVFEKLPNQIKKVKNNFCSLSCSATYNNKNKQSGNRRSKLECYLESQLNLLYPNLNILYNNKEIIGSELDIYISNLNLAFELNGIFHYEPIYGINKLEKIKENDSNKFKKCIERNISFCIIDTSSQKYFKESTSQKYLEIIVNIIKERTSELTS